MSLRFRDMTINDAPAVAVLHAETFNETHGKHPNGPTVELRQHQWEKLFQEDKNWFCIVIENEHGKLIGFAKGQPYNNGELPGYAGELNKIYLLKKYHKLGLGRQLICKVARQFVDQGITSMLLFGDENNPTNKFYEQMNGSKLYDKNGNFHGGYGWKDLQKLLENCPVIELGNEIPNFENEKPAE